MPGWRHPDLRKAAALGDYYQSEDRKKLGQTGQHANPEQMMEAVHVAAVMQAGITLVHSVQMQNHLKKLVL